MNPIIEPIGRPVVLGEGPFWDPDSQSLYFVDVFGYSINRYDTKTKEQFSAKVEGYCTIIIKVDGQKNKFVITEKNKLKLITWDGISDSIELSETLMIVGNPDEELLLNDGKVDSQGRLWIGSLSPQIEPSSFQFEHGKGFLYMINKSESFTVQKPNVTVANGLAWNPSDDKFYYIDSMKLTVDVYDYDNKTGKLSNEKIAFDLRGNEIDGYADGMTMDVEGKLWIAMFGIAKVGQKIEALKINNYISILKKSYYFIGHKS
uniref:SMP-30/Gluconolactonase/LRE-like region domain-containing protein n=1 Tax=Clastoptera arizonana TaxID=38151 RepID=A0A1B6DQ06_9HEMI